MTERIMDMQSLEAPRCLRGNPFLGQAPGGIRTPHGSILSPFLWASWVVRFRVVIA